MSRVWTCLDHFPWRLPREKRWLYAKDSATRSALPLLRCMSPITSFSNFRLASLSKDFEVDLRSAPKS